MLETYTIETLEQLRAISDPLRVRITDLLRVQPMTATQIGDTLKIAPAKIHYHVRELEKVGLLQLVETREKGGILEKYYQPVAHELVVSGSLLRSAPKNEVLGYIGNWIDKIKGGFMHVFRQDLESKETHFRTIFGTAQIYVTREEMQQLNQQLAELIKRYEKRRGVAGEEDMLNVFMAFPLSIADEDTTDTIADEIMQNTPTHNWVVGMTGYNKNDLEKVVQNKQQLHLSVVGICRISDDVSPELADKAIARLALVGKLEASDAVKEVLMRKRV